MQALGKILIIQALGALFFIPKAALANNRGLNQHFVDCAGRYERRLGLPAGAILTALRQRLNSANQQRPRRLPANSGFVLFFEEPIQLGTPQQAGQAPAFNPRSAPSAERTPSLPERERRDESRQEPFIATVPQDNNRMQSPLGRPFAVIGPCNRENRRSIICDNTNDFSIGMSLNLEEGRSGAGVSITIPLR